MGKTLIDVDEELLAQARLVLGTDTKKATVNAALRDVVRRWAVTEFGALVRSGIFDDVPMAEQEQEHADSTVLGRPERVDPVHGSRPSGAGTAG
jgi:hypothetical protein